MVIGNESFTVEEMECVSESGKKNRLSLKLSQEPNITIIIQLWKENRREHSSPCYTTKLRDFNIQKSPKNHHHDKTRMVLL